MLQYCTYETHDGQTMMVRSSAGLHFFQNFSQIVHNFWVTQLKFPETSPNPPNRGFCWGGDAAGPPRWLTPGVVGPLHCSTELRSDRLVREVALARCLDAHQSLPLDWSGRECTLRCGPSVKLSWYLRAQYSGRYVCRLVLVTSQSTS